MTKECLTFSELNQFCSPSLRRCAVGCGKSGKCSPCELCNCPTYNKRLCYTRVISKTNGKQQALLISKRKGCRRCPGRPSTSSKCRFC